MKPYYDQDGITIYHGDCLAVMPTLETGSASLVLTDPPFAVRKDEWDQFENIHDFEYFTGRWLRQSHRIAQVVVSFFADRFVPLLRGAAERSGVPYRRALIWRKPPGSQFAGASLDGHWFDFEMILVFGKPAVEQTTARKFGVLDYRTVTGQQHGCQKPAALLETLIDSYALPDGAVLDPFMGTGTTLRAAKDSGRRAIGIERTERYCEIAAKRLAQGVLFGADQEAEKVFPEITKITVD